MSINFRSKRVMAIATTAALTLGVGTAAFAYFTSTGSGTGTGTVNSVDPSAHKINLSHGAIPAIGWPAMTMDFSVAPSVDLRALKPGAPVNFMMERGSDGMYVVHSITPAGGGQ